MNDTSTIAIELGARIRGGSHLVRIHGRDVGLTFGPFEALVILTLARLETESGLVRLEVLHDSPAAAYKLLDRVRASIDAVLPGVGKEVVPRASNGYCSLGIDAEAVRVRPSVGELKGILDDHKIARLLRHAKRQDGGVETMSNPGRDAVQTARYSC